MSTFPHPAPLWPRLLFGALAVLVSALYGVGVIPLFAHREAALLHAGSIALALGLAYSAWRPPRRFTLRRLLAAVIVCALIAAGYGRVQATTRDLRAQVIRLREARLGSPHLDLDALTATTGDPAVVERLYPIVRDRSPGFGAAAVALLRGAGLPIDWELEMAGRPAFLDCATPYVRLFGFDALAAAKSVHALELACASAAERARELVMERMPAGGSQDLTK